MGVSKTASKISSKSTSKKGGKLSQLKNLVFGARANKDKNKKDAPKEASSKPKAAAPKKGVAPQKPSKPLSKPVKSAKPAKVATPEPSKAPAKLNGAASKRSGKPAAGSAAALSASAAKAAKSAAKLVTMVNGASPANASSEAEAVCREVACEGLATSGGYCRLHYIKNWKKIKRKELILKERKLNQYIEELVAKYPDKYIEAIRQDLANDKDFAKVIYDLDLDESVDEFDVEGESMENLIDTIKRDFDDEGETF